jgi:hypothetical protein
MLAPTRERTGIAPHQVVPRTPTPPITEECMMLTFNQVEDARILIEERAKARRLLERADCGVTTIGEYVDEAAISAIVPAHRAWLEARLAGIDADLAGMGIDVSSEPLVRHLTISERVGGGGERSWALLQR